MTLTGATMFARYAYPPNVLGYCGPEDASPLLSRDSDAEALIARHAREFEGAWTYLELIAAAAEIADPLDERVVEAYWVGNDLLDGIDPVAMLAELRRRFIGQNDASWTPGLPHHSFHVFTVYPWVGLLRPNSEPSGRGLGARAMPHPVGRGACGRRRTGTGAIEATDIRRRHPRTRPRSGRNSGLVGRRHVGARRDRGRRSRRPALGLGLRRPQQTATKRTRSPQRRTAFDDERGSRRLTARVIPVSGLLGIWLVPGDVHPVRRARRFGVTR